MNGNMNLTFTRFLRNNRRVVEGKSISKSDMQVFGKHVQDYIKSNHLGRTPKEISMELPQMIEDLEQNEQLRDIAGDGYTFRQLVEESIFK